MGTFWEDKTKGLFSIPHYLSPLCWANRKREKYQRGGERGPILQRQSISLQLQEEQSPSPRCIYPISEKGQGTLGDAVGYIEVLKQCSKGINIES